MSNASLNADPRMAGLPAESVARMHAAARAIRDGATANAQALLDEVLARSPGHPEALRVAAILQARLRRHAESARLLREALARLPDDALLHNDLGSALMACGDADAAFQAWRQACALAPGQVAPWFNLGRNLQLRGDSEAAVAALLHATTLASDLLPAQVLLGDALVHLGRFDDATARYRAVLSRHPACGDAWRGLSNIKTRPLSADDARQMEALLRRGDLVDTDRIAVGHALGKLEEDRGRYPEAFAALTVANALGRRRAPWSGPALLRYVESALAATLSLPAPLDPGLGHEAILIVGLPRSGSTLFEQILAAHPEVEGASELPDLGEIVQAESMRRGQPYPQWVASASAQDWQRLGREYLARTARWRARSTRFTDKMPENWKHAGILRAMLPGATILDIRRDPIETGWSCFRQQFYQLPHFSCDLADIAIYLRACEAAMDAWRARDPARIRRFRYEDLVADPQALIRAVLEACDLPFAQECMASHQSTRSVRTASAAQVREPLRGDTARAHHYGALLDPLRAGLSA